MACLTTLEFEAQHNPDQAPGAGRGGWARAGGPAHVDVGVDVVVDVGVDLDGDL